MAKNDLILLDGIIDERIAQKIPSDRRDEVFEHLSFEQLLKDYDLSLEEIEFIQTLVTGCGLLTGIIVLIQKSIESIIMFFIIMDTMTW